jgi:hypothetical protein
LWIILFIRSALTHTLWSCVLVSAFVFVKCNNLRLYVLHRPSPFRFSSGGRHWLVIIKLDCYGLRSVFFSVAIVMITISFRLTYKKSDFLRPSDWRINLLFLHFWNLTCMQ